MAQITWNKGETAQSKLDQIETIINGADVGSITQQVTDTFEQFSYDDTNLTAQQKAGLNSYFNSNGWTDVTPAPPPEPDPEPDPTPT